MTTQKMLAYLCACFLAFVTKAQPFSLLIENMPGDETQGLPHCQNGTGGIAFTFNGGSVYTPPFNFTVTDPITNTLLLSGSNITSSIFFLGTVTLSAAPTGPGNLTSANAGTWPIDLAITDGNGQVYATTVSVSIVPPGGPVPSVTASNTTLCPMDSVYVSANANTAILGFFNNSNLALLCDQSGNCSFVPPSLPSSYTLTLNNQAGTCACISTFNVSSSAYSCATQVFPALSLTTLSAQSQVPAGNFTITQDLTITGNINFSGKNILIDPGVKITVANGAILSIRGSYLHSCNCMWYGIFLQGNGQVFTSKQSVIEDAVYAISTDVNGTPTIDVANTLFNKNNIAVYVRRNTNTLTTKFKLDNSIFTCRQLSPGFLAALAGNATIYNTVRNNFVNNWATNPYQPSLTRFKHRSNVGVMLEEYSSFSEILVGTPLLGMNVFDFLNYGVLAVRSNFDAYNNQFSNMPGNGSYSPLNPSLTGPVKGLKCYGVGIYAHGNPDKMENFVRIGSAGCPPLPNYTGPDGSQPTGGFTGGTNYFYNTLRGVDVYNYLYASAEFNRFDNTKTDAFAVFATPGLWTGQYGVQVSHLPVPGQALPVIGICNNHLNWTATGIHIMRSYYNASAIRITCNEIGNPCQGNTAQRYIGVGIFCEDVAGSSTSNIPNNGYEITNNTVRQARLHDIYALNIKKGLNIYKNGQTNMFTPFGFSGELSVDPVPANAIARPNACIFVNQCQNGSVNCNQSIFSRKVSSTAQNRVHGIHIFNSQNITVYGNLLGDPVSNCPMPAPELNWGVSFQGACNPAVFNNTKFKNTWSCYNLFNSTIGPQGTFSNPTHHDWQLANLNTWQTSIFNGADPCNSHLFLYTNTMPVANLPLVPPACFPNRPYRQPLSITLSGSGSPYTACPFPPWVSVSCPPNINFVPDTVALIDTTTQRLILADTVTAMVNGPERVWQNQRFLFERLKFDNLAPGAPADVQQFYLQHQNAAFGRFADVDEALALNDFSTANLKNNFAAVNNLELKQQRVNTVKIKLADTTGTDPINAADIDTLMAIANGCPETDGGAFWEARTLLNILQGRNCLIAVIVQAAIFTGSANII